MLEGICQTHFIKNQFDNIAKILIKLIILEFCRNLERNHIR